MFITPQVLHLFLGKGTIHILFYENEKSHTSGSKVTTVTPNYRISGLDPFNKFGPLEVRGKHSKTEGVSYHTPNLSIGRCEVKRKERRRKGTEKEELRRRGLRVFKLREFFSQIV